MKLNEFIQKNIGCKIDFDGVNGPQCVDLFRQYGRDVLGIPERLEPCTTSGGAKDLFLDYPKMPKEKKYFDRFGGLEGLSSGDIVVWGQSVTNRFGHVAIYMAPFADGMIVFEQDGFKQDGAKINIRSRNNVLGYLRLKS